MLGLPIRCWNPDWATCFSPSISYLYWFISVRFLNRLRVVIHISFVVDVFFLFSFISLFTLTDWGYPSTSGSSQCRANIFNFCVSTCPCTYRLTYHRVKFLFLLIATYSGRSWPWCPVQVREQYKNLAIAPWRFFIMGILRSLWFSHCLSPFIHIFFLCCFFLFSNFFRNFILYALICYSSVALVLSASQDYRPANILLLYTL